MRRTSSRLAQAGLWLTTGAIGLGTSPAQAGPFHQQVVLVQPSGTLGAAPTVPVSVVGVAPGWGWGLFHHRYFMVASPTATGGVGIQATGGTAPPLGLGYTAPSLGMGYMAAPTLGYGYVNTGAGTAPSLGSSLLGAGAGLSSSERTLAASLGGHSAAIAAAQQLKTHISDQFDSQSQRLGAGASGSSLISSLVNDAISFASKQFFGIDLSPVATQVESLVRDVIQEKAVENKANGQGPAPADVAPAVKPPKANTTPAATTITNGQTLPIQVRAHLVIDGIFFNGTAVKVNSNSNGKQNVAPADAVTPVTNDEPGLTPPVDTTTKPNGFTPLPDEGS